MSEAIIEMPAEAGRALALYLDKRHRSGSWSLRALSPARWEWCGATPTACVVRAYLAGIEQGRIFGHDDVIAAANE